MLGILVARGDTKLKYLRKFSLWVMAFRAHRSFDTLIVIVYSMAHIDCGLLPNYRIDYLLKLS